MTGIIYCAENIMNNKVYIGQTIKTLNIRKNRHIGSKEDRHFQRALKKYDNWNWKIICNVEAPNNILLKELLNISETMYIEKYDSFKNGYNLTTGGDGGLGRVPWNKGKKFSDESKAKMSVAHMGNTARRGKKATEETRVKLSESHRGYKHTDEQKAKISASQKGRVSPMKGKKHSEETKKKMSIVALKLGLKSEETKKRMRKAQKGKTFSEETRIKIGEASKRIWAKRKEQL